MARNRHFIEKDRNKEKWEVLQGTFKEKGDPKTKAKIPPF